MKSREKKVSIVCFLFSFNFFFKSFLSFVRLVSSSCNHSFSAVRCFFFSSRLGGKWSRVSCSRKFLQKKHDQGWTQETSLKPFKWTEWETSIQASIYSSFSSLIYSRRWQKKNAKVVNERGWSRGKQKSIIPPNGQQKRRRRVKKTSRQNPLSNVSLWHQEKAEGVKGTRRNVFKMRCDKKREFMFV